MSKSFKLILNFILWLFGVIYLLNIFINNQRTIWSVFYSTLFAITLIPPLSKILFKKLRIRFIGSKVLISAVFLCLLIYSGPSISPKTVLTSKVSTAVPVSNFTANDLDKVMRVVDGDTIEVEKNNVKSMVRLIGVDTPELLNSKSPAQCFAKEASNMTSAVLSNKEVYLESDPSQDDKDIYNRLLRYVILKDGTNFNKQLILGGFAHEYTFKNIPYKYQKEFQEAQNIAQITKKGLWNEKSCPTISTVPTIILTSEEKFSCNIKKTICSEMTNCAEAIFYLKTCGISRLDANVDGIPCEKICK